MMDVQNECDDPMDDDDVNAQRSQCRSLLSQIAEQARQALSEQSIDTSLFFLVPNSGKAILVYGTPGDPDDAHSSWERAGEIVGRIVAELIGLRGIRRRAVTCATTSEVGASQSPPNSSPCTEASGVTETGHSAGGSLSKYREITADQLSVTATHPILPSSR